MIIAEFPPKLDSEIISGGRIQSITDHPDPTKPHAIVASQFCGLWKTEDGGWTWYHLDGLLTVFVRDVKYSPDGNTVIATLERDNQVKNGGGIWVSHDGGNSWSKPPTGDPHFKPSKLPDYPHRSRIPARISAYGISYSPDDPKKVYVGTDYGIAISLDNGDTWYHKMLENVSTIWTDSWNFAPNKQNSVLSVLALPNDKAIVLSGTGVYMTDQKIDVKKPSSWVWKRLEGGNFIYQPWLSCKNIDVWPLDNDKIFILQDYYTLWLYELSSNTRTKIKLPPLTQHKGVDGKMHDYIARGPFVRVSRRWPSSPLDITTVDIWVGLGENLWKARCENVETVLGLTSADWTKLDGKAGLHSDTGYLELNSYKRPVLYGSDGGLYAPVNDSATLWSRTGTPERGYNSLQITDVNGTNVKTPAHTCLYIATQDNSVWASSDGGYTWPYYECCEGSYIQVMKEAESDKIARVTYGAWNGGPTLIKYSDDVFKTKDHVSNKGTDGKEIENLSHPFFISANKWIRFRNFLPNAPPFPEIYISEDNGEKWRLKANVALSCEGLFTVSGSSSSPVVYVPFRGTRTSPDGSKRVGLIRLTDIFSLPIDDLDDRDLIYLDSDGSLGQRATEFDWHAVYGVDPNNSNYIIAPDVYNNRVMVSRDGGDNWNIDNNLTREVTKEGKLLLYDEDPSHIQVTQISFDPYNPGYIYIGTRDAGIVRSTDGGKTWHTLPSTNKILLITNFFFMPGGHTVIVSSYGRGLWIIHTRFTMSSFPALAYCRRGGCKFRRLGPDFDPLTRPVDWWDKDVTIFLNGKINGLTLSGSQVNRISVTPGTTFIRYLGRTKHYRELNILESEQGEGFDDVKGLLAALENEEVIKGVILKENQIFGIISGKEEFKDEENKSIEGGSTISHKQEFREKIHKPDYKSKRKNTNIGFKNPYLFISTSIPVMGIPVIGKSGFINLFAKGFKFDPKRNKHVKILIDSQVVDKNAKILQDGNVIYQLIAPEQLSLGEHIVTVVQKINGKSIKANASFVKVAIDDIDEDNKNSIV